MDFISFNTPGKEATSQNGKKANQKSAQKKPSFGSPAIGFGSPAVGFGAPAAVNSTHIQAYGTPVQTYGTQNNAAIGFNNTGWPATSPVSKNFSSTPIHNHRSSSPQQNHFTPRGGYNSSPRGHYKSQSPRHQTPYNPSFTPSPLTGRSNSFDGNNFKAPHQYSPGRGRGNVRKSFSSGYHSQSRNDPHLNSGGSLNIEDYYNPGMVQDPWKFLKPTLVKS